MLFEGGNIHLDDYIVIYTCIHVYYGFPDGSVVKNIPANAGDLDLILQ